MPIDPAADPGVYIGPGVYVFSAVMLAFFAWGVWTCLKGRRDPGKPKAPASNPLTEAVSGAKAIGSVLRGVYAARQEGLQGEALKDAVLHDLAESRIREHAKCTGAPEAVIRAFLRDAPSAHRQSFLSTPAGSLRITPVASPSGPSHYHLEAWIVHDIDDGLPPSDPVRLDYRADGTRVES